MKMGLKMKKIYSKFAWSPCRCFPHKATSISHEIFAYKKPHKNLYLFIIQEKNMSFYCYEDSDSDLLINFDYWVSGVAILTVGIGGIIGNSLTLLALASESRESRNSFNK